MMLHHNTSWSKSLRLTNHLGQKYGRLLVIEQALSGAGGNSRWLCQCECGKTAIAYGQDLKRGKVVSCGCWNQEKRTTHGQSRTHIHAVWRMMRDRCNNPNNPAFRHYGGRGIKVCERWNDFVNFSADMGDRPKGYQIERIDNDGDYTPGNCKWATITEQRNNMRSNHILEFNGESHTIAEWSKITGFNWYTIRARLKYGWSIERALTQPLMH